MVFYTYEYNSSPDLSLGEHSCYKDCLILIFNFGVH